MSGNRGSSREPPRTGDSSRPRTEPLSWANAGDLAQTVRKLTAITHYDLLGLPATSAHEGIVAAGTALHSIVDVLAGSSDPKHVTAVRQAIEAAVTVLTDVTRRALYDRFLADGKNLSKEEQVKRDTPALDIWSEMKQAARNNVFPKGTDVFLWKFHGLFYVAPAQDSFMCRLRLPGGDLKSWQMRGIADLAAEHGGGFVDVTTRANLQIREIPADRGCAVHEGLVDLGIINKGSGADNVRNVTAAATAGIDPHELIDTLPLAKEMHHHILNHRELYGLPRKFNISFDGGGAIATLEDTYDIGFQAVRVSATLATADLLAGIYFRLSLGGITGHRDFARDTGVLLAPNECVQVAHAVLQVFIEQGDQTDRQKARLNSACLILMAGLIVWSAPKTDPRGAAAVVGR